MSIKDLAAAIEDNEDFPVAISALVCEDEVGYPSRIVNPDEDSRPGEHQNFDEAYDFACDILGVEECKVEEGEDGYVWFKKA